MGLVVLVDQGVVQAVQVVFLHRPPPHSHWAAPHSKVFTMKPDLSLFPILNNEAKYSIWYKGFQAMA